MIPSAEETRERAEAVLREYWKYPGFRPGQWEVIREVTGGRDVLAVLPTGGGKSICYQVPALLTDGLTLVVSPLIALMQDQVAGLRARGIPAACLHSGLSLREIDQCLTDTEHGRYRLLYVAPERLESELFVARAARLSVSLLAVDEAHCVSEWGPHFRPAYLRIPQARALLGNPPTIAVTATATPEVRRDVIEQLALRDPFTLVSGFDRPNIVWSIFRTENKRSRLLDVIRAVPGSGVVYASTRRRVEEWSRWLTGEGVTNAAYHGGMETARRTAAQEAWLSGECAVMVATNAFGMGIDKPDVRFVVHVDLPGSLEAYYQEAGRGGRDGGKAYAVLLVGQADEATQRALIDEGYPNAREVRQVYDAVCNLGQVSLGSLPDHPLLVNAEAVAKLTKLTPAKIGTAVDLIARQESWSVLPPRRHAGLIRFRQPADVLRRHAAGMQNRALAAFLDTILRTVHAEAFNGWWEVDLRLLERRTGLSRTRLLRGLDYLARQELVGWSPPDASVRVQLTVARSSALPVDDAAVRRARRRAESRLSDMLRYARSVTCRRHFLLTYFGEKSAERCGTCDLCMGRHEAVVITPAEEPLLRRILQGVADGAARERWFEAAAPSPQVVDRLTDWLVQEEYLVVVDGLQGRFAVTEKARTFLEQWQPRTPPGG